MVFFFIKHCQRVLSSVLFYILQGERLDQGATKESWIVMIGKERCEVTLLSRLTLTCTPPLKRPKEEPGETRDGALPVVVSILI